jgi:glutaredoxin
MEATVRSFLFVSLLLSLVSLVSLVCMSCTRDDKSADAPAAAARDDVKEKEGVEPPMPVVTDDAKDLLFSYVDAHGRVQAASTIASVPEQVRARVLVVDLKKSPEERQAHRYAFFVDLTAKDPDGRYPVSVVSRYDAARGQLRAPMAPAPAGSVVVYSAVWCGFCKKAKAWLTQNNVPFIERDVEKMPGAQAELDAKLAAAGTSGGGIPVIDWGGTIVMGFDAARLGKLLREKPPSAAPAPAPAPSPSP